MTGWRSPILIAVTPVAEQRPVVRIATQSQQDVPILLADGVLDSFTYRSVRDAVIKAALEEPPAVIVDVDGLSAPSTSAWTVFTSARWHVSIWPDVPILLICEQLHMRREIIRSGVARYVPVYPTRESALATVRGRSLQVRRRARTELPRSRVSIGFARAAVTDWLTKWGSRERVPVAATVATVFVENVLDHTESAPDAWEFVSSDVIPRVLAERGPHDPIRVWSAGCASGQEAYTLAMLLAEALGPEAFRRRVKIYATDVDEDALTEARAACYDAKAVDSVPADLLARYFEQVNGRCIFHKDLLRAVIFGRNDLVKDAPISRVDLLVCRNTLMYLNAETQRNVLGRLNFALAPQGTLFLGHAEMLLSHGDRFTPLESETPDFPQGGGQSFRRGALRSRGSVLRPQR